MGFVALVACLAGATWFFTRPTTVTVHVVLAESGIDVTDHVSVFVGTIEEGVKAQDIRMGSISLRNPLEFDGTQFEVPPNSDLGILIFARGSEPVSQKISVPRGANETVEVALNAGLVNVAVTGFPEWGQMRVRDVASDEGIGPEIKANETLTFLFPAGTYHLEASQDLATRRQSVDVVIGETQTLSFDVREGRLSLALDTVVPWSDVMPDARISVKGRDNAGIKVADSAGRTSFARMPFGGYQATVELGIEGPRYVRSRESEPVPIIVDAQETEAKLSLLLNVVKLDLSSWDPADLIDADAMILSMIDLGLPYAAAEVADAQATLVFLPLEDSVITETFAVAIAQGNSILAIQDIGSLEVDSPVSITIDKGGDAALCRAVTEVANCDALLP